MINNSYYVYYYLFNLLSWTWIDLSIIR